MKVALAQINPIIGDFAGNADKIISCVTRARELAAQMVVFPELALSGYPPLDFLEHQSFVAEHEKVLHSLVNGIKGISCVLGAFEVDNSGSGKLYNSSLFIRDGKVGFIARKQLLPAYDVFAEPRYFTAGTPSLPFLDNGKLIGMSVCEDIWHGEHNYQGVEPIAAMLDSGRKADFLLNISASPYCRTKLDRRLAVCKSLCRRYGVPLFYVNQVGGQDELVFDGHSFFMDKGGEIRALAKGFAEDILLVDTEQSNKAVSYPQDSSALVWQALQTGLTDYLAKTGFRRVIIGLSGGIDSAVTAVLACQALGAENVLCVAMPSPYTADKSKEDGRILAGNLGCRLLELPLADLMVEYEEVLQPVCRAVEDGGDGWQPVANDVSEQNLQARIRGTALMSLANRYNCLLLATGNKSEMAVGYCTLYGDMNGGLAVLADVLKTGVYELARFINRSEEIIPTRIITRAPSAELKADQTDQDDLPPYEVLDRIIAAYVEKQLGMAEISALGFPEDVVSDTVRRIKQNEYKRRQAPPAIKVSPKAFGMGRIYPLAQRFAKV